MIFPFPYCVIWGQNNSSRSSDVDQTPLVAILNHVKSPFVVKFTSNPPFFTDEIQWNLPGFSNFHRWTQVAAGIWLSATPSPVLPPWPEVKRRLAQRYRNSWWTWCPNRLRNIEIIYRSINILWFWFWKNNLGVSTVNLWKLGNIFGAQYKLPKSLTRSKHWGGSLHLSSGVFDASLNRLSS